MGSIILESTADFRPKQPSYVFEAVAVRAGKVCAASVMPNMHEL